MMKISVIIPTCDRPEQLLACLQQLHQQSSNVSREVIVSDDGRAPVEMLLKEKFPTVLWFAGPRRGPAANRNSGAVHATGDWLAFTDDDCLPDRNWLTSIHAKIVEEPDVTIIEGATDVDRPKHSLDEVSPHNLRGGVLWSCNFAILKSTFNALGGYDETFPHAAFEDIDFHERAKSAGFSPVFEPKALVIHPWRQHGGWAVWQNQRASLQHYMSKHPEAKHFRSPKFWAGSIVRTAQQELIAGGIKYRGRGLKLPLQRICFQSMMLWNAISGR